MNTIKKITLSFFSCMIFLSMPLIGRGGWGVGAGVATGLIVGSAVANSAANNRYYKDRYYYDRDRDERHRDTREENRRLRDENERLRSNEFTTLNSGAAISVAALYVKYTKLLISSASCAIC